MTAYPTVSQDTYTPDRLIAGDHPLITETVTIGSGSNLVRGAVLGRITASGKFILSLSGASDGSQTPVAILADDAAAAGADVTAGIYVAGEFNAAALTLGASHTAASVRPALRAASIYLKDTLPAA